MTLQELNQHFDLLEQLSEAEEMLDAPRAAACPEHKIYLVCPTRRALGTRSETSP